MSVAGTVLLFSVDRDFRAVHVVYHSLGLGSIHGLCPAIIFRLIRLRPSRFRLGSAPQFRTNADAKATLPRDPRSSRNRFTGIRGPSGKDTFARARKTGRAVRRSRSDPRRHFCTRASSIDQRQHCDSRIFYFLVSRAQPLALVVALAWVHQSSKTGIGVPDLVSSVRFWLTLPNDFQGMGSYDRFATET